MEGLGNVIPQIEKIVRDSVKTTILATPLERDGVYMVVGANGIGTKIVADPKWHNETLETPAALYDFIKAQKTDAAYAAVFMSEGGIQYIYSLADRRDRAFVDLQHSDPFNWLEDESGEMLTQAEIVRLLRITMRGCLSDTSKLLEILRKLNLKVTVESGGDIQHGKESLGRNVLATATGAAEIPEEVTFNIPVYNNHVFRAKIVCAIEVFPADGRFRLTPYPMEMLKAVDDAMDDISFLLSKPDMPPLFRGAVFGS